MSIVFIISRLKDSSHQRKEDHEQLKDLASRVYESEWTLTKIQYQLGMCEVDEEIKDYWKEHDGWVDERELSKDPQS